MSLSILVKQNSVTICGIPSYRYRNTPLNGSTRELSNLHNPQKEYLVPHGAFSRLSLLFVYWHLMASPFSVVFDSIEKTCFFMTQPQLVIRCAVFVLVFMFMIPKIRSFER